MAKEQNDKHIDPEDQINNTAGLIKPAFCQAASGIFQISGIIHQVSGF